MNVERLKVLRDHLWNYRRNQRLGKIARVFDLNWWVAIGGKDTRRSACGTATCALGEAAFIPEFRAQGLGIRGSLGGRRSKTESRSLDVVYTHPAGWLFSGRDAAERFFDLTGDETALLFLPHTYPAWQQKSPEAVARRIDRLLKDGDL